AYQVSLEALVGTDHTTRERKAVRVIERNQRHAVLASDEGSERMALEKFDRAETILSRITEDFMPSGLAGYFHLGLTSWSVYQFLHLSVIREPAVVSLENQLSGDAENLIPVLHTLYSSD